MKRWIADLATTNFRIVVSIGLAVLLVIVLLTALMLKIELQSEIVWALVAFVGGMLGIDVTQFSIKRKTEIVTPPQTTAEHATVTTVATAPAATQPVGKPHPATDPAIVDAIGGGVEGALSKKEDLSGD
jgi:hypothetical protein